MSRLGRWSAIGAVVLAVATVATWDRGDAGRRQAPVATLDGRDVFLAKGCAVCHLSPATRPFGDAFPPLDHAPDWAGSRRPDKTAEQYLVESMVAPSVYISPAYRAGGGPTSAMPTLRLTAAEIDALVAYLMHRDAADVIAGS